MLQTLKDRHAHCTHERIARVGVSERALNMVHASMLSDTYAYMQPELDRINVKTLHGPGFDDDAICYKGFRERLLYYSKGSKQYIIREYLYPYHLNKAHLDFKLFYANKNVSLLPNAVGISWQPARKLYLVLHIPSFISGYIIFASNVCMFIENGLDATDWHNILCNVADILVRMHRNGYIHDEVQLENMFLYYHENDLSGTLLDISKACMVKHARKLTTFQVQQLEKSDEQKTGKFMSPEVMDTDTHH